MSNLQNAPFHPESEHLQTRFGLRIASYLSEQAQTVPYAVSERLRFARELAIDRARGQSAAALTSSTSHARLGAAAVIAGGGFGFPATWRIRLASIVPLIALIGGLVLIQQQHVGDQITAAAEIDADLLADALPPAAYSDAGFVEFLKIPRDP
jgi:hypothetical protein